MTHQQTHAALLAAVEALLAAVKAQGTPQPPRHSTSRPRPPRRRERWLTPDEVTAGFARLRAELAASE